MAFVGHRADAGDTAIAIWTRPLRSIAAVVVLFSALAVALLSGHMIDGGMLKASLPYLVNIRPDSASGFAISRAELVADIVTFARSLPRLRLSPTN